MKVVKFTVPGEPEGKARPRLGYDCYGRAKVYTPKATSAYEKMVRLLYPDRSGAPTFQGPVRIEIDAFFEIPKSTPKYKREEWKHEDIPAPKKPDFDNIAKIVCDALNGVAWKDDAQITTCVVRKLWSEQPRVQIFIKEDEPE